MLNEQTSYYAFISYNSADEKWAKWLQHNLEYYHIPSALCKEYPELPKKIRPVFWYKQDLSGTKLKKALNNELSSSKYLIVICSPDSAKADWVNDEVVAFIGQGKGDKIIPFIVSGTPHAKNLEEECFPPALRNLTRDEEIRGIDVRRKEGKYHALVDVIATMFDVRFDALWQRHERRRKKIRNIWIAVMSILLLLALGIFDYTRTKVEYYADYVDCWGIPKGVVELSKEQVAHRNRSYKFEYRRIPLNEPNAYDWRLTKVSYTNSAGIPQEHTNTEHQDRYAIQNIEYSKESGNVIRINYCKATGKVLLRHNISTYNGIVATIADFIASTEDQGAGFIGSNTSSMSMGMMDSNQKKSKIKRLCYVRDINGYIIKQTYHANNDEDLDASKICDSDGIYGVNYTLDSIGRRTKIEYINAEGKIHSTKKGVAKKVLEYEKGGNICKATYLDIYNTPVLNEHLWAIGVEHFDDNGNCIEGTYYAAENEECYSISGFAQCKYKYDSHGNIIEASFFDIDNNPCYNKDGSAKVKLQYDSHGNITEQTYLGVDGNLCYCQDGFAKVTYKYDFLGNMIEAVYYDVNGNLCCTKNGYAKKVIKYDLQSNWIEASFYGVDGELCFIKDGFAKQTVKYDARGNIVENAYYDTINAPCYNKYMNAKATAKYDNRNNKIEEASYDVNGDLCYNRFGFSQVKMKYDSQGNWIEEIYLDIEGNLCYCNSDFAKALAKYDSLGNLIELNYFDTDGVLCCNSDGYAKEKRKYDVQGNCIEKAFFDINDSLCYDVDGDAKLEYKYDTRGNLIELTYFGIDGSPHYNSKGICKTTYKYDNQSNCIEYAYFDTNNKLHASKYYGYAKQICKYDKVGNWIEGAYYDANNSPCYNAKNVSREMYKYDRYGNQIEYSCFDTKGKLCYDNHNIAKQVCKYDKLGNCIESAFYDTKNESCNSIRGDAFCYIESNRYSNEVKYFDKDSNRCLSYELVHRHVTKLDYTGNVSSITCYGVNDSLCMSVYGFAKLEYKYNKKNQAIETIYYDEHTQIIKREQSKYDDFGNVIEIICYDGNGDVLEFQNVLQIIQAQGIAFRKNIPLGSIVIKLNDYCIGESIEIHRQEGKKQKKELVYITPEGKIDYLIIEKGLLGVKHRPMSIEKTKVEEYLKKYEEWKKQQMDKNA